MFIWRKRQCPRVRGQFRALDSISDGLQIVGDRFLRLTIAPIIQRERGREIGPKQDAGDRAHKAARRFCDVEPIFVAGIPIRNTHIDRDKQQKPSRQFGLPKQKMGDDGRHSFD